MAGQDYSLNEAIQAAIDARVDDIFVARPGKVTAYDPQTNTATVKPMVKRARYDLDDDSRSYQELPEIPAVPILFPRAGDFAITLPISVGDTVLLLFCDVSLAEWRQSGEHSEPVDARRHSIGWPVALPGLFPDIMPMSTASADLAARAAGPVIGEHGGDGRIAISPSVIKVGGSASDFVALATKVATELGKVILAFNAHTHLCTAPATPSGTPQTPIPAAASVAASMVKAQ